MADEKDKINPNALSIVPSISLNKHINAVHNYSLQSAINMRMSNDRTTIQNIESIGDNNAIMDYLHNLYGYTDEYGDGQLKYHNSNITVLEGFYQTFIMTVPDVKEEEGYNESDFRNAFLMLYNDIDFINTNPTYLGNLFFEYINEYLETFSLTKGTRGSVRSYFKDNYETDNPSDGFEILYILPCNNELILFVYNKALDDGDSIELGKKCVELIRYNENTNVIKRVYSALTYYGGKYVGDYTYNYDNYLIITFCEYFDEPNIYIDNAVKTITLGNNGSDNDYNTLNCDEKLFYNEPELEIPNVVDIYKVSGKGNYGWYFFYIRYKINKYDYTKWTYIGYPILLEYKNYSSIFKNLAIHGQSTYSKNTITIDETKALDETIGIKMIFDNISLYNKFQLGTIIVNLDEVKKFRTDDLNIEGEIKFNFDIANLIEEDIDVNSNYNHYNVKNLVSYKNRIYLSNYSEGKELKSYTHADDIKLSLLDLGASAVYRNSYHIGNIDVLHTALFSQYHLINVLIANGTTNREFDQITQHCFISGYDSIRSAATGQPYYAQNIEFDINDIQYEFVHNQDVGHYTNVDVLRLRVTAVNSDQYGNIYDIYNATILETSKAWAQINIKSVNNDPIFNVNDLQSVIYYIIYSSTYDSIRYYNANELLYYVTDYDYFNLQENTFYTTLAPGEIYKFYIHFVDKFGNISKGFPIYNNRKLFREDGDRVTEYTIFAISHEAASPLSIMYPKLYAVPIDYTIQDINDLPSADATKIFAVNSITSGSYYDTFVGTGVTAASFKLLLYPFDKSLHMYDIGDERGFLSENFGLYINSKGERLFYVPYLNNNHNYGLTVDNVTIPSGYVGYYISIKKPFTRQKFVGIRNMMYYSDDMNILLEKPSFSIFKSFQLANPDSIVQLNREYKSNDSNTLDIIYFSAYDGTNKQYAKSLRYAGDPAKDRIDRSTVLGEGTNPVGDFYAGVGIDTNNNIYITKGDALFVIGGFKKPGENNIILSLPGHDFYTSAIYYDETSGFKYDTSASEANTKPTVFEIIQKANKYISRVINNSPLIGGTAGNIPQVYVLPIGTLDLFKNKISDRFSLDFNILEEFDEEKQYVSIYNNNILFSNVISDESIKEKWRKYDLEDYKLISENKGEIVNLFVLGDSMFIHCTQAIYLMEFKDYLATTEESLQISQSTIKDINYKELLPTDKGFAGLQDKDASIVGAFGYIFYENDTNRLLRLDGGELIHIDYPIHQWLQKYKPYEVRFANDVERFNLIIQFKYIVNGNTKLLILVYDYILNSFVSILNPEIYWFTKAYNTKNKLYILKNTKYNSILQCFIPYTFEKNIFKVLTKGNEYLNFTNKLSFVYNYNYNAVKFLESIIFKLYKYTQKENPRNSQGIDFTEDPIETIRIPYCGDYIRIYNENVDTGWIDIANARNKETYNSKNAYELPYYYLGDWMMNLFRNVKNRKDDINYSQFDKQDYSNADDRVRLYGNYFIIEFGFNINNVNDNSDKFEFQSLIVNVSQQTEQI